MYVVLSKNQRSEDFICITQLGIEKGHKIKTSSDQCTRLNSNALKNFSEHNTSTY